MALPLEVTGAQLIEVLVASILILDALEVIEDAWLCFSPCFGRSTHESLGSADLGLHFPAGFSFADVSVGCSVTSEFESSKVHP